MLTCFVFCRSWVQNLGQEARYPELFRMSTPKQMSGWYLTSDHRRSFQILIQRHRPINFDHFRHQNAYLSNKLNGLLTFNQHDIDIRRSHAAEKSTIVFWVVTLRLLQFAREPNSVSTPTNFL